MANYHKSGAVTEAGLKAGVVQEKHFKGNCYSIKMGYSAETKQYSVFVFYSSNIKLGLRLFAGYTKKLTDARALWRAVNHICNLYIFNDGFVRAGGYTLQAYLHNFENALFKSGVDMIPPIHDFKNYARLIGARWEEVGNGTALPAKSYKG